jgi:hypothetical protein
LKYANLASNIQPQSKLLRPPNPLAIRLGKSGNLFIPEVLKANNTISEKLIWMEEGKGAEAE